MNTFNLLNTKFVFKTSIRSVAYLFRYFIEITSQNNLKTYVIIYP